MKTKTQATHTPTPWTQFISHQNYHVGICSTGGKPVALVCKGSSYEEADANAAFIVRAVNSHEVLLDALIMGLPYVETALKDRGYRPGVVDRMVRKIREAIALAEDNRSETRTAEGGK